MEKADRKRKRRQSRCHRYTPLSPSISNWVCCCPRRVLASSPLQKKSVFKSFSREKNRKENREIKARPSVSCLKCSFFTFCKHFHLDLPSETFPLSLTLSKPLFIPPSRLTVPVWTCPVSLQFSQSPYQEWDKSIIEERAESSERLNLQRTAHRLYFLPSTVPKASVPLLKLPPLPWSFSQLSSVDRTLCSDRPSRTFPSFNRPPSSEAILWYRLLVSSSSFREYFSFPASSPSLLPLSLPVLFQDDVMDENRPSQYHRLRLLRLLKQVLASSPELGGCFFGLSMLDSFMWQDEHANTANTWERKTVIFTSLHQQYSLFTSFTTAPVRVSGSLCCSHQWSTSLCNMVLASAWSCIITLHSTAPLFEGHQQVRLPVGKPELKLFLYNTPSCVWFFSLRIQKPINDRAVVMSIVYVQAVVKC